MKNLRISVKLLLSFAIVAVIAAIVGTVGIIGITSINADYTESYIVQTKPLPDIAKVLEFTQRMRVQLRNLVIYSGNQDHLPHVIAELETRITEYNSFLDNYSSTIVNDEARDRFDTARNAFNNDFMPLLNEVRAGALAGKPVAELSLVLDRTTSIMATIVDNFSRCMDIKIEAGANSITKNTQSAAIMLTTMIVVMIIAMVAAMLLGIYIAKIIGGPVKRMKTLMDQVGTIGDLEIDPALEAKLADDRKYTDEIGQTVKSFDVLIEHIISVSEALKTISDGDLTENIRTLSDRDVLSVSLLKTQDNLNKMFSEINSSSHQVTTGSVQIADGAQLLAQGATEQSATVEELSASVTEIAQKTKINAGMAGDAKNLAESIKQSAEKGSQQMGQMMQAVREINEASQSIGKVIKIIDDIAFQTNILALNAAVEAARAGQHGKGFAVVADEVRSLAAKSAEAAKNTSELIETSIKKAELGASISEETSESLNQIVEGIVKSSELVAEISHSSDEQAQAIGQISEGIDQVSQVVQQNSATAEQSAAASEEMSGQAMLLQQLIAHFKLKDSSNGHPSAIKPSTSVHTRSISAAPASTGYSLNDGGKY